MNAEGNHDAEGVRLLAEAISNRLFEMSGPDGDMCAQDWDSGGAELPDFPDTRAILAALDGEIVPKGTLAGWQETAHKNAEEAFAWSRLNAEKASLVAALHSALERIVDLYNNDNIRPNTYIFESVAIAREALLASGEPVEGGRE